MATVSLSERHTLPPEEAKVRIRDFEEQLGKYGMKAVWTGLKAQLKGPGASGEIAISSTEVRVELKLGLLAKAAGIDAKRLEGSIRKRLAAALSG